MSHKLFRPGGPVDIEDLGSDQFRASITLPRDEDGRMARECPDEDCSPGTFKVKPGTGITGDQALAYCPYCRHAEAPDQFATKEQQRYAKDLVMREVQRGADGMIRDAFGLGASGRKKLGGGLISMEISLKSAPLPYVRPPAEDEVRRDVVCPSCGLDHTVFGLATWCADCGTDIFLTHVATELAVVRSMAGDIDRRREALGRRVAARDLENCLEDAVSIFEAAMKALARRHLAAGGLAPEEVDARLKKLGNTFQNITRTGEVLRDQLGLLAVPEVPWVELGAAFEKRHPITHNLGVVDRKYLERAQATDREGREVGITAAEVNTTLDQVLAAVSAVHGRLFPQSSPTAGGALPPEESSE
jgi:hypothetical protein